MSIITDHCEHAFWGGDGSPLPRFLSEPLCAFSGLIMCVLALKCTAGLQNPPLQFCMARASLLVCGFGTAAYHMLDQSVMDETRINGIMLDGVTMAMVTVNVFLLHLSEWMLRHPMAVSVFTMLYLLFWVGSNDMLTFQHLSTVLNVNGVSLLSMGIQYPLFVAVYVYVLIRIAVLNGFGKIWPMWLMLGIALVAWVLNQFGCSVSEWFFIGHVVWHVCIGYVAVYMMVLGLLNSNDGGFEMVSDTCEWWVELKEKEEITACAVYCSNPSDITLDTSKLFNQVAITPTPWKTPHPLAIQPPHPP
jgi:hypothetical protein